MWMYSTCTDITFDFEEIGRVLKEKAGWRKKHELCNAQVHKEYEHVCNHVSTY